MNYSYSILGQVVSKDLLQIIEIVFFLDQTFDYFD